MGKIKLTGFFFMVVFLVIEASSIWSAEPKPRHAPNNLPGVEPEMLNPDYWIALKANPDKVIMTFEEIERFNEKVRNKKVNLKDYYGKSNPLKSEFAITELKGPVMNPLLPLDMPDTLPGDDLRERFEKNVEWLYSRDFYDGRNAIYSDGMKKEVVDTMNIDAIPDGIKRRFGVVVTHTNVRHYPTSVPGYNELRWEMDMFQATALLIGNPVAIIHESVDGDFLYIESPVSRGWVDARNIAIADRGKIQKFTGDKNFLMAAGNKVPVYGDASFKNFSRYFQFSATMPLIRHNSEAYVVSMGYRKPDGSLGMTKGYIKPDADVHIGYLPYTKRNVITQIFMLLNQPYGWADQNDKRDCSGTMRVLFRCFGIKTGRHPSFILSASDRQAFIDPSLSTEEKKAEVSKIESIITVAGTSGHIVLYLGKGDNGKLYFMHQAGWGYKDKDGANILVNRVTINCVDHGFYTINSPRVFTTLKF